MIAGRTPSRSVAARIILVIFGLVLVVLSQYARRLELVDVAGRDYLIVAIIAVAVVFALVRLREGLQYGAKPSLTTLGFWFVVASACVSGILLLANALLDPGPAREFTTLVATEHCGGRRPEITVTGAPTLPVVAGTMRVNVLGPMCRAARDGDTVVVLIGPGYFGRAWVQGTRPVQTARQ